MLKNLSIRTSLTLMIAFFGVVLLLGAAAGLLSLRASNASLQQMYTVDTPAVADLEGSAGQLLRLRLALATYASLVDLSDQEGADAVLKRFDQYQKASDSRLAHYLSRASADADERRMITDMQTKRDTFLHEGVEPALAALKSSDRTAFQQLQAHKLPSLYSAYEKSMLALEQWQQRLTQDRVRVEAEHGAHVGRYMHQRELLVRSTGQQDAVRLNGAGDMDWLAIAVVQRDFNTHSKPPLNPHPRSSACKRRTLRLRLALRVDARQVRPAHPKHLTHS